MRRGYLLGAEAGSPLLRVTVTKIDDVAELKVEGCVVGEAAVELWAECQRQKRAGRRIRLDLDGVRLIDSAGVVKLRRLMRQGVEVVNASLLVSALLTDEK
jgi:ABC-type transporter Mla MlaB component